MPARMMPWIQKMIIDVVRTDGPLAWALAGYKRAMVGRLPPAVLAILHRMSHNIMRRDTVLIIIADGKRTLLVLTDAER